jgi:hypothetical protein
LSWPRYIETFFDGEKLQIVFAECEITVIGKNLVPVIDAICESRLECLRDRPDKTTWNRIREKMLLRDRFTCQFCGHRAEKYMQAHHLGDSNDDSVKNLVTCCVACHAVNHFGRNLALGLIEIWQSPIGPFRLAGSLRTAIANRLALVIQIWGKPALLRQGYAGRHASPTLPMAAPCEALAKHGGMDGTRTRDLLRDRQTL